MLTKGEFGTAVAGSSHVDVVMDLSAQGLRIVHVHLSMCIKVYAYVIEVGALQYRTYVRLLVLSSQISGWYTFCTRRFDSCD